jgi:hypothetical protein
MWGSIANQSGLEETKVLMGYFLKYMSPEQICEGYLLANDWIAQRRLPARTHQLGCPRQIADTFNMRKPDVISRFNRNIAKRRRSVTSGVTLALIQ